MTCECQKRKAAPPEHLRFIRCRRGFLLDTTHRDFGGMGEMFAFDRIEDVGAWLVEQYGGTA